MKNERSRLLCLRCEEDVRCNEPVIRIDGKSVPLSVNETGRFGITMAELKAVIYKVLYGTKSGSRKQRVFFELVLKYMKIRTHGKPKEDLLKVYVEVLREMKAEGMVGFKSGKTAVYVYV